MMLPGRLSPHLLGYAALAVALVALGTRLASQQAVLESTQSHLEESSRRVTELTSSLEESSRALTVAQSATHTVTRTVTVRAKDGSSTVTQVASSDTQSASRSTQEDHREASTAAVTVVSSQRAQTSTTVQSAEGGLPGYSLGAYWQPGALSATPGGLPSGIVGGVRVVGPIWVDLGVSRTGLRGTTVGFHVDF